MDRDLDHLEPSFRIKVDSLLDSIKAAGIPVMIVETRRTIARQQELYNRGRTTPGAIVTKARPGDSAHNYGQAIDICPIKDGRPWWTAPDATWKKMADIGTSFGLVPGYYFKSFRDAPHFESTNWRAARAAWKQGKVTVP